MHLISSAVLWTVHVCTCTFSISLGVVGQELSLQISRVMRKPDIWVYDWVRHIQCFTSSEDGWRREISEFQKSVVVYFLQLLYNE